MIGAPGTGVVEIRWVANPFRADRFERAWLPVAEAALDFGAHAWAFVRSREDPQLFTQYATFPDKLSFERYWYSEEVAEARAEASGLFQVPVLPIWNDVVGSGATADRALER
ncbi:MAG TPA: hypothetical protein VGR10_01470 [Thermoleophilaceae bacterium]|nr:hypothetical protein [Thermoleophilaceae bacterium]